MGQNLKQFSKLLTLYKKIALDSSLFIYHIEENTEYLPLTKYLFEELIPKGKVRVTCSNLILTEILVRPYAENKYNLVLSYKALIIGFPNLTLIPLDNDIADQTAYFRARYNLRTPDAIHIATAVKTGAEILICNDKRWKRIEEVPIIVLDEFIPNL